MNYIEHLTSITTPCARFLRPGVLLSLLALAPLTSLDVAAQGSTVSYCNLVGLGGDNASVRGIRFKVDQNFTAVEVHVQGASAGLRTFDFELRRSDGYVAPLEATGTVMANLNGSPGVTPYQTVLIDFGQVISVSGLETFTLKALSIVGGTMYWEVAGINNIPCPDAEVTNENNTATPTMRTSAMGLRVLDNSGPTQVGAPYCAPAVANTTGNPANLRATGSDVTSANDLTLVAEDMPANQFGFFLTSMTQGNIPNPGGSQGILCLGGTIGRYVAPGQIQNGGAGGTFSLALNLTQTPAGPVFVSVNAGETWNFQAWFRDVGPAGQPWSNFTNGLSVSFL